MMRGSAAPAAGWGGGGQGVVATVTAVINGTPDAVFAVLADGWAYAGWVVGASHVRAVEAGWPARGSKLHHASGAWPLVMEDETERFTA